MATWIHFVNVQNTREEFEQKHGETSSLQGNGMNIRVERGLLDGDAGTRVRGRGDAISGTYRKHAVN